MNPETLKAVPRQRPARRWWRCEFGFMHDPDGPHICPRHPAPVAEKDLTPLEERDRQVDLLVLRAVSMGKGSRFAIFCNYSTEPQHPTRWNVNASVMRLGRSGLLLTKGVIVVTEKGRAFLAENGGGK